LSVVERGRSSGVCHRGEKKSVSLRREDLENAEERNS